MSAPAVSAPAAVRAHALSLVSNGQDASITELGPRRHLQEDHPVSGSKYSPASPGALSPSLTAIAMVWGCLLAVAWAS